MCHGVEGLGEGRRGTRARSRVNLRIYVKIKVRLKRCTTSLALAHKLMVHIPQAKEGDAASCIPKRYSILQQRGQLAMLPDGNSPVAPSSWSEPFSSGRFRGSVIMSMPECQCLSRSLFKAQEELQEKNYVYISFSSHFFSGKGVELELQDETISRVICRLNAAPSTEEPILKDCLRHPDCPRYC